MTIRIQSIQVQNLGPIDSIQESLGQVNLIYGLNESGKTYLVEFLLSSLFRQARKWELRRNLGKGSVQVDGLTQEPITFSPESNRKIEHYWEEDGRGLPINMARLLVVKGGELALSSSSPGGVNRDTLKSALTSQELLDQIWDTIPATVRNAKLDDGLIIGKNMGSIKTHGDLADEIDELENLLESIEVHYSQGPAREIENQLEVTRQKLERQYMAKRRLAYLTWQKLEELDQQRELFNKSKIQELRDSVRDHEYLEKDIKALKTKLEKDNEQAKDYPWLETALEVWEEKGLDTKKSPSNIVGITGLSAMVIGAAVLILEDLLAFPESVWIGAGLFAIGLFLSSYFGLQITRWKDKIDDSLERKTIQEEYERRFKTPLHGLTDLKTRKSDLHRVYISAQTTQSLIDEKVNQWNLKSQSIDNLFRAFSVTNPSGSNWQENLKILTRRSKELDDDLMDAKLQLSKLDIPQEDFHKDPTESDYDPRTILELEEGIQGYENRLKDLQEELNTLKARACERTGDDIKKSWVEVLFNLQSLLAERILEYKQLTAEMIAQIGLVQVLTRLREEEDQKIVKAINTKSVSDLLYKITGRYHKLDLVDDLILVHDAFSSYPLSEISTGAREQVQLALRLGIASQVCGGDPLFLILDDAFQHSDWQRREALVRSTLELARGGWQIIYLSMDDHIRDLYLQEIKPSLKKDFKLIQLS